ASYPIRNIGLSRRKKSCLLNKWDSAITAQASLIWGFMSVGALQDLRAVAFKVRHCGKENSADFLTAANLDKALDAIPAFHSFL
ncbi:hypothetical protein H0H87_009921, partial [Tephrocybe sp. NHM501043]